MIPIFRARSLETNEWIEYSVFMYYASSDGDIAGACCIPVGTMALPAEIKNSFIDIAPSTLQQKIHGHWLTMEQVEKLICCNNCENVNCGSPHNREVCEDCIDGSRWRPIK